MNTSWKKQEMEDVSRTSVGRLVVGRDPRRAQLVGTSCTYPFLHPESRQAEENYVRPDVR